MEYLSKNFINLHELKKAELIEILTSAEQLKADRNSERDLLDGKSFILLFDKPSTRTRISFETGFFRMGGHALFLGPNDI